MGDERDEQTTKEGTLIFADQVQVGMRVLFLSKVGKAARPFLVLQVRTDTVSSFVGQTGQVVHERHVFMLGRDDANEPVHYQVRNTTGFLLLDEQ